MLEDGVLAGALAFEDRKLYEVINQFSANNIL